MIQLPFELLQLIFIQLTNQDLLQCQLTCKRWNQVSAELFYSNIKMKNTHRYYEYTCTIKNSPRLARFLKYVDIGYTLGNQLGETYDLNDLLSTVVENCPNLLELRGIEPNYSFWTRLTYAANQGQLLRLRRLPKPTNNCIESYIYTALSFKKTLNSLVLCGQPGYYSLRKFNYATSYQIIFNSIKEFSNLQDLVVGHYTDQLLSYWDAWIDNCHYLKSLTVSLFYTTQRELIRKPDREPNKSILQRSDIQKLDCHWEIIKCDEQLKYIIHKFPKLQDLKVVFDPHLENDQKRISNYLSSSVMVEFLQYASTIPKINIGFDINKEYVIDIFTRPKKLATSFETVLIEYSDNDQNQDKWTCHLLDKSFEVEFVLNETITELPHVSFLSKVGNRIRSLTIDYRYDRWDPPEFAAYNNICGDSWVYQALQLCPQLQEFTMRDPVELADQTDITFQHVELKSFSVSEVEMDSSLEFLERLSSNAPNLGELHLTYTEESIITYHQVVRINMPFTSFSIVTWNCFDLENDLRQTNVQATVGASLL
ncbi:hypothetical protein BDF21DRAFT_468979 [Thamnidium elegans]|nr:hypothetical protein BDF21DRAFT_468979 [Thamnidium elegans]